MLMLIGGFGQQKCPQKVHILEDYLTNMLSGTNDDMPKLKGTDCYVVPERRHWPVWDPVEKAYVNAINYIEDVECDTRESLLNLSRKEAWSLAPIRIFNDLKQERGKLTSAKTYTLKKWGISRAEWARSSIVPDGSNHKLLKAYSWLIENNETYRKWCERHAAFLIDQERFSAPRYFLRTSDLLLHEPGVEVAAFPILYPRACFGDTSHKELGLVHENCEKSIFTSHLRKLLSPCAAYIMQPLLTFLLYDIGMLCELLMGASKVV